MPLPSRCTYCPYWREICYIFILLGTNRLCCYCGFYLRITFCTTVKWHCIVCLPAYQWICKLRENVHHVIQFSFLFSCPVFMLFFYLVTQSVIWFLHCHLGLASCISNSTLSSSITSLFLCLMVTAGYCFWVHLQNNFNKWILTLTCLSVCMEQLSFHLVDFHEILYWSFVLTSVVKIKVWLNSGKSNRHFSWRHM